MTFLVFCYKIMYFKIRAESPNICADFSSRNRTSEKWQFAPYKIKTFPSSELVRADLENVSVFKQIIIIWQGVDLENFYKLQLSVLINKIIIYSSVGLGFGLGLGYHIILGALLVDSSLWQWICTLDWYSHYDLNQQVTLVYLRCATLHLLDP